MVLHVFYFAQPQYTKSRPTYIIANSRNSCLPTRIRTTKNITEDILHKIYIETGAIIGI